ncbi:alpha/beta fold hydrolase [Christiangramia echinicola]|uniref:Pimeloyl-ACP methyl ester carboxylesterase n=1 Tax=Christiangramia echinicola TaxID=279359 RepID=A0A1H1R2V6_9FLAO|nr:alpha/beta hydrolase [Christiangramia echinicola]SDS29946.1 Pimeloyl-ACP methyl ester carboxylesterase [Christiangramia echinicola]
MTKNTKDKTPVQRLLVPSYILTISRILTTISPFLASRFAAKLFLTPFKYKIPNREKEMDENSIQKTVLVPSMNREIVTYEYGSSAKKVLLVHGWSGSGTQLAKIAKELLEQGYMCVSFDAPAHGKAEGKMSMMPFFIKAIHYMEEQHGPFEAVIGHSLGGMSSLRAIRNGMKTNKLVIIGTANNISEITRHFAENMKMNHKVARKMKAYLDDRFNEDMDILSGGESAKYVKTPTLVIHDEEDVDVKVKSAYEIHEELENSELMITSGLGHRRILGNEKVINKITTFIAAQSL